METITNGKDRFIKPVNWQASAYPTRLLPFNQFPVVPDSEESIFKDTSSCQKAEARLWMLFESYQGWLFKALLAIFCLCGINCFCDVSLIAFLPALLSVLPIMLISMGLPLICVYLLTKFLFGWSVTALFAWVEGRPLPVKPQGLVTSRMIKEIAGAMFRIMISTCAVVIRLIKWVAGAMIWFTVTTCAAVMIRLSPSLFRKVCEVRDNVKDVYRQLRASVTCVFGKVPTRKPCPTGRTQIEGATSDVLAGIPRLVLVPVSKSSPTGRTHYEGARYRSDVLEGLSYYSVRTPVRPLSGVLEGNIASKRPYPSPTGISDLLPSFKKLRTSPTGCSLLKREFDVSWGTKVSRGRRSHRNRLGVKKSSPTGRFHSEGASFRSDELGGAQGSKEDAGHSIPSLAQMDTPAVTALDQRQTVKLIVRQATKPFVLAKNNRCAGVETPPGVPYVKPTSAREKLRTKGVRGPKRRQVSQPMPCVASEMAQSERVIEELNTVTQPMGNLESVPASRATFVAPQPEVAKAAKAVSRSQAGGATKVAPQPQASYRQRY